MSLSEKNNRYLRRQLQKQIEENLRLRRRIDELSLELGTLRTVENNAVSPEVQAVFSRQTDTQRLFSLRSYLSYMMARLRSTSAYAMWQKMMMIARRYRLLTTTFRVITLVITWIETSALVLLYTTIMLVAVPILLVGGLAVLIVGMFQHHRCNEELSAALAERSIYVCFADKAGLADEESYFCGMVRAFAEKENAAVIVISPFFWRSGGVGERRSYVTLRHEAPNIYLIRRHYFFSMRKHVLRKNSQRVTMIY